MLSLQELRIVANLPGCKYSPTYSFWDIQCSIDGIWVNCDIYDKEGKAEVGLVETTTDGVKSNGHLHFAALVSVTVLICENELIPF